VYIRTIFVYLVPKGRSSAPVVSQRILSHWEDWSADSPVCSSRGTAGKIPQDGQQLKLWR